MGLVQAFVGLIMDFLVGMLLAEFAVPLDGLGYFHDERTGKGIIYKGFVFPLRG